MKQKCLDIILDTTINGALTAYRIAATARMLSNNDKATLIDGFLESFTNAPGGNSANTYVAIAGLLLKTTTALAVTAYQLYEIQKEKNAFKRHWEIETEKNLKIMINLLKTPTKEYFDKMIEECKQCYDVNYNRKDCKLDDTTGDGKRYRRSFEKIPDFEQNCGVGTRITYRIHKGVTTKQDYVFDVNIHLKNDITPEERDDFIRRFRLYRAINGIAEFEDRAYLGDELLASDSTIDKVYGYFVIGLRSIILAPLAIAAVGAGHYRWCRNANNLEKIILDCIIGCSPTTLKAIIKRADALARIKNIVETTKSDFIDKFYNERLLEMYSCIRPECLELFINAFNVYCRIKNYGEYNPQNHLNYDQSKLPVSEEESTYTRLIESGLKKVSSGLEAIGKDTTQTHEIRRDENGDTVFTTTKVTLPNTTTQVAGIFDSLASNFASPKIAQANK